MLAWLLREGIEECESAFVSPEKYIHTQKQINDTHTGNEIGKLVYTLKVDDEKQSVFLLDLDIVLNNNATTSLHFINLLEGSSDSNEYYEVETLDEAHLEIETVNRHTKNCTLLGRKHDVRISAFPYELSVFSNILALNKYLGFSPIELNNTGILVAGLSNRFIMPGGIMDKSKKVKLITLE
jgi:hypothetical protein